MTARSRFCSTFLALLLFCLAASADAAYKPMDAISKVDPDAIFYILGEVDDLKEMTTRLSRSFALKNLARDMRELRYLPQWLRSFPAQKAALLFEVSSEEKNESIRLNIALSFGDEYAPLLRKIEKKAATPAEIFQLLAADFGVKKSERSEPDEGDEDELIDFFGITAPEEKGGEYRLDNMDMELTARGNLLLISVESALEPMREALRSSSLRHVEKRRVARENSIVLHMGKTLLNGAVGRELQQLFGSSYEMKNEPMRFEASIKMRENGWNMKGFTNLLDLFLPSPDVAAFSKPLEEGSFLSAGGRAPLAALSWHVSLPYLQRMMGKHPHAFTNVLDLLEARHKNPKDNPASDVKKFTAQQREAGMDLFKLLNTVSLVVAKEKLSEKGAYYVAFTKGDAATIAQLDKALADYIQKNNLSKRYRKTTLSGWDSVYLLDASNKIGTNTPFLALRGDQVVLGLMDPSDLNVPLKTSGMMVEELIANRKLIEFIYFDVAGVRRLAWEKLLSDGDWRSKISRRNLRTLYRVLQLFSDFKEIGVEVASTEDFHFRFITGGMSAEERSQLLFMP